MKSLLTFLSICCLLFAGNLSAQNFIFPQLKKKGKTLQEIVPPRWTVIDSAGGDLNKDQLDDIALIFEFHTPVKEKRAYGDNTTDLITELQKPRILAIYFRNKNLSGYTLALQNNDFILRSDEGGVVGDPLQPITISKNKIHLSFSGGSNWRWNINYSFLYQKEEWHLVEAINMSIHNVTGEMYEKQYNFVTKKVKSTEINAFSRSSNPDGSIERDLNVGQLRTFHTFKKPWTWRINEDDFL